MTWWLYIIIGFIVGAIGGGFATRLFYFPRNIGVVQIVQDPEDHNTYMFLKTPYKPDDLPNNAEVAMTIRRIS